VQKQHGNITIYTRSLKSMDTAKYFQNSLAELVENLYLVKIQRQKQVRLTLI
jgi:hypothetical protein